MSEYFLVFFISVVASGRSGGCALVGLGKSVRASGVPCQAVTSLPRDLGDAIGTLAAAIAKRVWLTSSQGSSTDESTAKKIVHLIMSRVPTRAVATGPLLKKLYNNSLIIACSN
jgi:hypothetical protein